jgi:hypothetical protein
MKKWRVYATVVGSKCLGEYEAETAAEAEEMALDKEGYVSLCHQCSREIDDPQIDEIEVEEATP